jgi:CsoR family transcriptional regulator, copper-sensing transcriptional repressor
MSQLIDPDKKRQMMQRLARVEGQIRGIQKLIEQEQDCEKIAQQLSAARKALDKSFFQMVACMMEQGDLPPQDIAKMLVKFS